MDTTDSAITIIARFAGRQEATVRCLGLDAPSGDPSRQIIVHTGTLVVTLRDGHASAAILAAYVESAQYLRSVFGSRPATPIRFPAVAQRSVAAVELTGPQPWPAVTARTAEATVGKQAEISLRIGRLVFVCADLPAWEEQMTAWARAHEYAHQLWRDTPDVRTMVATAARTHRAQRTRARYGIPNEPGA